MDSATIDSNSKQFLFTWHEMCGGFSSSICTFIPQKKAAATSIRNYQQKITCYKVSAWNWQVLPPLLVDNKPRLAFETTNQGIDHKLIEQTAVINIYFFNYFFWCSRLSPLTQTFRSWKPTKQKQNIFGVSINPKPPKYSQRIHFCAEASLLKRRRKELFSARGSSSWRTQRLSTSPT